MGLKDKKWFQALAKIAPKVAGALGGPRAIAAMESGGSGTGGDALMAVTGAKNVAVRSRATTKKKILGWFISSPP